jgi:transposase-like protein
MAIAARYFDLVREMKDTYNHRLRLVESAKRIGIKHTARLFVTSAPTVRKWLRRYQQRAGLLPLSRARNQEVHPSLSGLASTDFSRTPTLPGPVRLI